MGAPDIEDGCSGVLVSVGRSLELPVAVVVVVGGSVGASDSGTLVVGLVDTGVSSSAILSALSVGCDKLLVGCSGVCCSGCVPLISSDRSPSFSEDGVDGDCDVALEPVLGVCSSVRSRISSSSVS